VARKPCAPRLPALRILGRGALRGFARNDGRETKAVSWCSAVVSDGGATGSRGGLGSLMTGIAGIVGGGKTTGRDGLCGLGRGSGLSDLAFAVYAYVDTGYDPESSDVVDAEWMCMPWLRMPVMRRGASELSLSERTRLGCISPISGSLVSKSRASSRLVACACCFSLRRRYSLRVKKTPPARMTSTSNDTMTMPTSPPVEIVCAVHSDSR
jgi:hypothetical protein